MDTEASKAERPRFPLYARVMVGVLLGVLLGEVFGTGEMLLGLKNEHLGRLGMLVIRVLKMLAVPLVLFSVLDALIRTRVSPRDGWRLLLICGVNVMVAMGIGLALLNTLEPGLKWKGHFEELTAVLGNQTSELVAPKPPEGATLSPLKSIEGNIPESLVDPLLKNNIIAVVLMALLFGSAIRRVGHHQMASGENSIKLVETFVSATLQVLIKALEWVIQAIPLAVFGIVAHVVGRTGSGIFIQLWDFFWVILLGLMLHALVYYPLIAWGIGRKSPRVYLGGGADAIITGLSTNSSLATVPVTLKCLTDNLGVSVGSARLSTCIGTNLNNDGITLYEAMTVLFIAQATGMELEMGQQLVVVLASIMAAIGVAGIPEAGIVVLPLVLGAAGLPEAVVVTVIPLILPVDWALARVRSGVNVMSDMVVAILLDVGGDRSIESSSREQPSG